MWECGRGSVYACSFVCTWQASAFISVVPSLMAGPPVEALRWRAGLSKHLTRAPAVARKTLAEKRAMCVHTHASVQALSRLAALVDVVPAVLALEAGWARTVVVVIPVGAAGTVSTWACGAGIDQRAVLTYAYIVRQKALIIRILEGYSQIPGVRRQNNKRARDCEMHTGREEEMGEYYITSQSVLLVCSTIHSNITVYFAQNRELHICYGCSG